MERYFRSGMLALCLLGTTLAVGSAQAAPMKPMAARAAAKVGYVCPKCGRISATAGQCAHCKVALVRRAHAVAAYECKMCGVKSVKAGNCPMCGKAMTKLSSQPHKM